MQNVVDFMVDDDLLKAGDVTSIDALYTDQFVH